MSSKEQNIKFQIYGRASQSTVLEGIIPQTGQPLIINIKHRGISLASSCKGKGLCKKCVVWFEGKKILACQQSWNSLMALVGEKNDAATLILEVDYL